MAGQHREDATWEQVVRRAWLGGLVLGWASMLALWGIVLLIRG